MAERRGVRAGVPSPTGNKDERVLWEGGCQREQGTPGLAGHGVREGLGGAVWKAQLGRSTAVSPLGVAVLPGLS